MAEGRAGADALPGFEASGEGEAPRGATRGVREASPSAARCTTARNCHAAPYSRQHPAARQAAPVACSAPPG